MLTFCRRKLALNTGIRSYTRWEDCFPFALKSREMAYPAPTKGFSQASSDMAMLFAPKWVMITTPTWITCTCSTALNLRLKFPRCLVIFPHRQVVQRHPELVDNYIVMNCPHAKYAGLYDTHIHHKNLPHVALIHSMLAGLDCMYIHHKSLPQYVLFQLVLFPL